MHLTSAVDTIASKALIACACEAARRVCAIGISGAVVGSGSGTLVDVWERPESSQCARGEGGRSLGEGKGGKERGGSSTEKWNF